MTLTATCRNFDCVSYDVSKEIVIVRSENTQPENNIYHCEDCGEHLTIVYKVQGRKGVDWCMILN